MTRQRAVLDFLAASPAPVGTTELVRATGATRSQTWGAIKKLAAKGLIRQVHCERGARRQATWCVPGRRVPAGWKPPVPAPLVAECLRRGHGADVCGGYGTPPWPTAALPGTPEKERVLTERAAACVSLWHPEDAVVPAEWSDRVIERLARFLGVI